MERVLITGGAGFIGSEIVRQLYENNKYEVTVIDNMSPQIHGTKWENSYLYNIIKDKCNFKKVSVCDYEKIKDIVADNEYIIHLAAETGTGQSMYMINQYNETNIMGTSNILQAISNYGKESKVKKIILSSSRSVYGEGAYRCPNCGEVHPLSRKKEKLINGDFGMYCNQCGSKVEVIPTNENSKVIPSSLYAFTKYAQEKMLETMCPALGIDYTIFRFQNVYGVGQSLKNPYTGILSIFSTLMLENKPINIFEDGMESRDFVNVKDIASAVIKSISVDTSNSQVINLGSGKGTTVLEIAQLLKRIYQSNSELNVTGDFRIGDIANNFADISKAKRILDFEPRVSLEEGINDFCRWVKKEDIDNSGYENSLHEMEKSGLFIRNK